MPSSVIAGFSYDEVTKTLFIAFQSGEVYAYLGVEPDLPEAFRRALSKGRFFAARIRGRYPYRRLPPGELAGEPLWPRPTPGPAPAGRASPPPEGAGR